MSGRRVRRSAVEPRVAVPARRRTGAPGLGQGRFAAGGPRISLAVGAFTSVAAAVAVDVWAGEHPTHTLTLALVALAVAGARLVTIGRRQGFWAVVGAALVAQPALHMTSQLGSPVRVGEGFVHVVVADGPVTAMQVAATVAVVVAGALSSRVADVVFGAVRRPVLLLTSAPAAAVTTVRVVIDARREGSMLRWCGWSIRSARRGPPEGRWCLSAPSPGSRFC